MRHSVFGRGKKRTDIYSYDMITDIIVKLLQFSNNLKISLLHIGILLAEKRTISEILQAWGG